MRLRDLLLHPFAGFRERRFTFAPGLNVVLGANDVGKSTLFRAIDSALFLPSRVNKSTREGKEALPRVLPLGGDHARITLRFDAKGATHRLEKGWGQGAACTFETEGGARLAEEQRVEEALRALLPAASATFQHVLFVAQGALEGTVHALEKNREALHSLGDLLRVSTDQAAGVSVEGLRSRLAARIGAAFAHWDRVANLPEKGRGIENEWTRDVGSVLAAYYARERLRRDVRAAQELETERDRKLERLSAAQAALDEAKAFVRDNEAFVASASERQGLEASFAAASAETASLERDCHAWLRAENETRLFRPEVERLEPRRRQLEDEWKQASAQQKGRELAARLERARAAQAAFTDARARVAAIPALRPEDVKRLRAAVNECDRLKQGGKKNIQVQLHVKRDLEVSYRKDFEAEGKGTMLAGKSMRLSASSRVQIGNEWFELQVTGGEDGLADAEASHARAQDALGKLLAQLKVASLDEAEDRLEKLSEAQRDLKAAEAELARALPPGEQLADLEKAAAASAGTAQREPDAVRAELSLVQGELEAKAKGLAAAEIRITDLRARYGIADSEAASRRLFEAKGRLAELEKKLAALPALPASIGKLEEFLPRFRRAQAETARLWEEARARDVELAEVKAKLPEQSAQDLERAHRDASRAFERELARGRALLRVEEAVLSLENGSDPYDGFRAELEKQVALLSGEKYRKTAMNEALPAAFERGDGTQVPYGWLSAGTKDAFALALRLAMAGHCLGASDGFLLVDDPLVNMDPARQKTAAGMLREFAAGRQVVVFTCHPLHAELLGGERILLE